MNLENVKVDVRSEVLTEGELNNVKGKVDRWASSGHTIMAIMYFLRRYYDVSGTQEAEKFVITIHKS